MRLQDQFCNDEDSSNNLYTYLDFDELNDSFYIFDIEALNLKNLITEDDILATYLTKNLNLIIEAKLQVEFLDLDYSK